MEFKKSNRYSDGRPRLSMPMRDGPVPHDHLLVRPQKPAKKSASTAPPQPAEPATKTINVNIKFGSLPSKKAAVAAARRFLFAKKTFVAGIVIVAVAGLLATGAILSQRGAAGNPGHNAKDKIMGDLSYPTVLPAGKSVSELGGWRRVSPPDKDPVYAYADKIGSVAISVSQQPLPQAFKNDTDAQVAELAKKFNATVKIDGGDTTAYIGTSAKGPQSVIFAKNDALVLIKSQEKIDDKAWAGYIGSLK